MHGKKTKNQTKERRKKTMSKIICSPGSYVQGNGEMKKLAEYCQGFGAKKYI